MKWFMLFMLIPCLCVAQTDKPALSKESIRGGTGINTRANDRDIKPSEQRIAHEVDLARNGVGTISKRYGFDTVGTVQEVDSLVSIYAAQFKEHRDYRLLI